MLQPELKTVVHRLKLGLGHSSFDGECLERYVTNCDQAAFAQIVENHGRKVFAVCHRILGEYQLAEDAFQATFLILAKKAHSIIPRSSVGGFLYGVARKAALETYAMNRRRKERQVTSMPETEMNSEEVIESDTLAILDEEIANLSDAYRTAVVLCELDGKSRKEAARELKISEGTLSSRLAAARKLLAQKMKSRGVILTTSLMTALVSSANAIHPPAVIKSSETISAIANSALKSMFLTKFKLGTFFFMIVTSTVIGSPISPIWSLKKDSSENSISSNRFNQTQDRLPNPEINLASFTPIPKPAEWKEEKPILFESGRITSVAITPNGKSFAVARHEGKLDFFETKTRKRITEMNLGGENGAAAATHTAITFSPTPDSVNGDIFAVTHKHGVKFGTIGLGIFIDDAHRVTGVPPNYVQKDFDPHQLAWLREESFVASNGKVEIWRLKNYDKPNQFTLINGSHGQQSVLTAIPGESQFFLSNGSTEFEKFEVQITAASPLSSPQTRLIGHQSRPILSSISADCSRIVSADTIGTIIVWDGKKWQYQKKHQTVMPGLNQIALSADGKFLAIINVVQVDLLGAIGGIGTIQELYIWDLNTTDSKPKMLWKSDVLNGKPTKPSSLVITPDGGTILAAFEDPYPLPRERQRIPDLRKSIGLRIWTRNIQPQDNEAR